MNNAPHIVTTNTKRATITGVVAVVLWSFFALVARYVGTAPPLQLTAMGFGLAALVGLAALGATGRLGELRQPPLAWLHGVGGLFGFHALYFLAFIWAPPTQAAIIEYSWPLLTVLISAAVLGLRLHRLHLVGLALGFAGCSLLVGQKTGLSWVFWPGYLCALLSALVWGLYSALAGKLKAVPTGAMIGFYAATALLSLIAHLLLETTILPTPPQLFAIALLGLGPMGGAFFLWDYGIKRGDPRVLGTMGYVGPVVSYLLLCIPGFAVFTPTTVVAALLVGAGGLLAARA